MKVSQDVLERLGIRFVQEKSGIAEFLLESNSLKILLFEDHCAPVVATAVEYFAGARNESLGHTGAFHFLEHLAVKNTEHFNRAAGNSQAQVLKPIGADYNAFTLSDCTYYQNCFSREHLSLVLAVEADRMRHLLLKDSERRSEMTVIRSELEISENSTDDALDRELYATAFREHPYRNPVIGWKTDVEHIGLAKLKEIYDTYYWPNNAVLVIAGDFDPEEALTIAGNEFGAIEHCAHAIPRVHAVEPQQRGMKTFNLKRVGDFTSRVLVGYHMPAASHPDHHVLAVIAGLLGTDGIVSSRFYSAFIDSRLAVNIDANCPVSRDPDLFKIGAILNGNTSLARLKREIFDQLELLKTQAVSASELARVKRANRNFAAVVADDLVEFVGKICEAEGVSDWTWLVDYNEKFDAVTAKDIKRVARKYFVEDNCTFGCCESEDEKKPVGGKSGRATKPAFIPAATDEVLKLPVYEHVPVARPGADIPKTSFGERAVRSVLPNGLTLIVLPMDKAEAVTVYGVVRAGKCFAPKELSQLGGITANMLMTGTCDYSKRKIGQILEDIGTELEFKTDYFSVDFESTLVSTELSRYLDLVASMLRYPEFNVTELRKCLKDKAALVRGDAGETDTIAEDRLARELYKPGHPYHKRPVRGLLRELKEITVGDVRYFHDQHYTPENTILCVVGNVNAGQVKACVEAVFGDWEGLSRGSIVVPKVDLPARKRRVDVHVPDKANVDILIGVPCALKSSDPDYQAAAIANSALGLDALSSRLGEAVRVRSGLSYDISSAFDDVQFGQAAWVINLSVNPANVDLALEMVEMVVADYLEHGITERELLDEAGRTYGGHLVEARTSATLAAKLATLEFTGAPLTRLDTVGERLYDVTLAQANAVIRKYFRLDKAVTVVVGSLRS